MYPRNVRIDFSVLHELKRDASSLVVQRQKKIEAQNWANLPEPENIKQIEPDPRTDEVFHGFRKPERPYFPSDRYMPPAATEDHISAQEDQGLHTAFLSTTLNESARQDPWSKTVVQNDYCGFEETLSCLEKNKQDI